MANQVRPLYGRQAQPARKAQVLRRQLLMELRRQMPRIQERGKSVAGEDNR